MSDDARPLSTSALAKALNRSVRQMFAELAVMGWIRRQDDQWVLTAKGEFEGGVYRESNRFGRYIVWPASVVDHRALVQTQKQHLSATLIGREYGLNATLVNRLFAERGWIRADGRSWRLTESGKTLGGMQREDDRTGIAYVVWPQDVIVQAALLRALPALCVSDEVPDASVMKQTLDGHHCAGAVCVQVCNWLYLAGVVHAVDAALPLEEHHRCDFYIPSIQLFIDDWSEASDPQQLAERIKRQSLCEQHGIDLLVVESEDALELTEWLPRELRRRGLDV